jgi:hypothetical protein
MTPLQPPVRTLLLSYRGLVLLASVAFTVSYCRSVMEPMCSGPSRRELAKLQVDEYRGYYNRWLAHHADGECTDLLRIGRWVDPQFEDEELRDPWGQPLVAFCFDGWLHIFSAGEDGLYFTADDILSWKPRRRSWLTHARETSSSNAA